ncbi:MAG TPA: nicotinate phosphoribosyltransferase, partial [Erysipelotrichaceae bacterium]|nr:nicotinate phosphoribosyltransferase [Erysipelotrichaceae bacterium]
GSRACYIGGVDSTATLIADQLFGVKAVGTMAHSWVQYFDNEYQAFLTYAKQYPTSCTLLVDTYDVLTSGIPNAIKVHNE